MQPLLDSPAARLAAALLAVALSGALPLLEGPHAEPAHHCQCPKGGHHDCDCPLCQAEAVRAAGAGAQLPPCHLAAAKKARDADRKAAARRAAAGPTLASTCGTGDHRIDPPPTVVHFTIPDAPVLTLVATVERLDDLFAAAKGDPVEPETPPPRTGSPA